MIFVIEFSLKYKMIFIYFLILRKKCDVHFSKSIYLSIWIWGVGILATEDRSEVYLALPAYNHFTTFIYLCLCLKSVFYLLFKYQPSVIVKTESICCCFSSRLQQRATLRETKPVWLVFQWNQKQMFSRMFLLLFYTQWKWLLSAKKTTKHHKCSVYDLFVVFQAFSCCTALFEKLTGID